MSTFTEQELDANGPGFAPGTVRYWVQDGPDFYLFDTMRAARGDDAPGELAVCTFPHSAEPGGFSLFRAREARQWFLEQWCPANNVQPIEAEEGGCTC